MINILVLEDDEKLNYVMCTKLNSNSYNAIGCRNAMEALDKIQNVKFNLIISDIMMPQIDGFEFVSLIRRHDKMIPIMFITVKNDFAAKEHGYRIGIDDYLTKPVDLDEMLLHVGALLRRANIVNEKKITIGEFYIDAEEMTAYFNGDEIPLTVREFNILFKLLSYPKRTFTRNQLMDSFWGSDSDTASRTLDVHIARLREKLIKCDEFEIQTIRGIGYKAVPK
ncbi:transcriptional regulator [Oenococcus oeni S25]|uniref:response regulator transcription factor n=7 Tax=Oenococcus oeni TaxID=1247 RepID=UPI00050F0F6C|nr:response regulator transcription factor [Oenococcus oeni]KGO16350.1 transcriptional regulator [Oenococcus oeni X2L]KGH56796.1 transcriptional regulator [Oenococcus oeni S22]KGH71036.1 transcriptional regulator [Oenococcus oeni S25]KGH80603.1 transcriptional regulator [Oenococcus oeni IOEB_0607]KGH90715.1 transcriptional regulator [Oenococcus oeni IOEB_L26_1]